MRERKKSDDRPSLLPIILPRFFTLKRIISNFSRPASALSVLVLSSCRDYRTTADPNRRVLCRRPWRMEALPAAEEQGGMPLGQSEPSLLLQEADLILISLLASPLRREPSSSSTLVFQRPFASLHTQSTHVRASARERAHASSFFSLLRPPLSLHTCMAVHSIPSLIAARLERRAGCQSPERRSIKIHERPRKKKRRGNNLQETVA